MQRLASVMDAAPLPVFALDEDGCYVYENEAGRVFLGYEAAEIAGKHVTDLIVYDPSLLSASAIGENDGSVQNTRRGAGDQKPSPSLKGTARSVGG